MEHSSSSSATPSPSNGTKVFFGANEMVYAFMKFIDKTKNRYDVYSDSSGPSLIIGNDKLTNKFFEFKNRGGSIRYIAEITQHNYTLIKKDIWKIIVLFYKAKKSCINQSGIGYKQKYRPKKIFERKKKIKEFIIDETLKIGSELIWLGLLDYRTWE